MTRIAIVCPAPLLAAGLVSALRSSPQSWQAAVQADGHGADAVVLHGRDAAELRALHAALPAALPAVVLGPDLRELSQRTSGETRALALLSPDASAARLQAAVAAVLAGLQVRERAADWPRGAGGPGSALGSAHWDHEPLTPRELEVFELLGKGLSNRDVAGVLGISTHTAKFHVGQILSKVGAATRAEAVSSGLKLGLIGL